MFVCELLKTHGFGASYSRPNCCQLLPISTVGPLTFPLTCLWRPGPQRRRLAFAADPRKRAQFAPLRESERVPRLFAYHSACLRRQRRGVAAGREPDRDPLSRDESPLDCANLEV